MWWCVIYVTIRDNWLINARNSNILKKFVRMCEEENDNVVIHLNERDVSVLVHSIRTPNSVIVYGHKKRERSREKKRGRYQWQKKNETLSLFVLIIRLVKISKLLDEQRSKAYCAIYSVTIGNSNYNLFFK